MKIVVFTDYVTCSQCKKAKAVLASFAKWCAESGVAYVSADRSADKPAYVAAQRQYSWTGGSYPGVYIVDAKGKTVLRFVARGMTLEKLIAKVAPYCDGCGDDVPADPVKPTTPAKPTKPAKPPRKKRWFASLLVLALGLAQGCVISRANFKPAVAATETAPAERAELAVWRGAVLYPFKMSGLEFDTHGMLRLGGYETDGGAAGFCTVLDSSGKFMGTMSAAAAKAALAK